MPQRAPELRRSRSARVTAALLILLSTAALPLGQGDRCSLSSISHLTCRPNATPAHPINVLRTTTTTPAWTNLSKVGGTAPSPRLGAAMAYDVVDGYAVLFGGAGPGANNSGVKVFRDTWVFKSGNWSQIHPATSPPSTQGMQMIYDPVDKYMVAFGGAHFSANGTENFPSQTWTFSHGNWTRLSRNGISSPHGRISFGFAFDVVDGYAVLFGGYSQNQSAIKPSQAFHQYNDTWTFVGGKWSKLILSPSPSKRFATAMAYDASGQVVVLQGGWQNHAFFTAYLNDTWTFAKGAWIQLPVTSNPTPGYRAEAGMAYLNTSGGVILFGGKYGLPVNDTWLFKGGSWTQVKVSGPPSPREAFAFADDGALGGVLLFGGVSGLGYYDDSWEFTD